MAHIVIPAFLAFGLIFGLFTYPHRHLFGEGPPQAPADDKGGPVGPSAFRSPRIDRTRAAEPRQAAGGAAGVPSSGNRHARPVRRNARLSN